MHRTDEFSSPQYVRDRRHSAHIGHLVAGLLLYGLLVGVKWSTVWPAVS